MAIPKRFLEGLSARERAQRLKGHEYAKRSRAKRSAQWAALRAGRAARERAEAAEAKAQAGRVPLRKRRSPLMDRTARGLRQGQASANQANELRYQQILALYQGMGRAQNYRADRDARIETARGAQNMISRGLGNSTVLSALRRRIGESLNMRKLDIADRVATRIGGVMERRTDSSQDPAQFAPYAAMLGRYGR